METGISNHHGDTLRAILKTLRIKQIEFADKMGFTRGYAQQVFNKKEFKAELIEKICKVLKIEKVQFFYSTPTPLKKNDNYLAQELEVKKLEIQHLKEKIIMLEEDNKFLKSIINPKTKVKNKA